MAQGAHFCLQISSETVKRRLRADALFGRTPVKKLVISAKNKKARLAWVKEHLNWTPQQWSKVLWSDESKFLMGTDGISFVRRPVGTRFDV